MPLFPIDTPCRAREVLRQFHVRIPRGNSRESQAWHGDYSKVRPCYSNNMNQSPHPRLAGFPARILKVPLQLEDGSLEKPLVAYRIVYSTESHPRGHIVEFAQLHPAPASIQPRGAEPHYPSEDVPTDARARSPTGARNERRPEFSSNYVNASIPKDQLNNISFYLFL